MSRRDKLPGMTMLLAASAAIAFNSSTANATDFFLTDLTGGVRLQYLATSTDTVDNLDRTHNADIDKIWADITAKWNNSWFSQLNLEAKKVGTDDQVGPEIRELTLQYRTNSTRAYAGQFILPFGRFATSQLSDPQTKELGEWFTNTGTGLAVSSLPKVQFDVSGFGQNDQTEDGDQNGYTLGVAYSHANIWHVGAAFLGTTQRNGRDVRSAWTANVEITSGQWIARTEIVVRDYVQAERQSAWYTDVAFRPAETWEFGLRHQGADGYSIIDDADKQYRDWSVSARYRITKNFILGLELLRGTQETGDGETISRDEVRSRFEIRV